MSEEFDILKQKQKKNEENKDGERNRSHSYLNEIIYGLQSQETEQRKLEIEEYENINLNINDITIASLNDLIDIKNNFKNGIDALQNMRAISLIRKKKVQIENALRSSKNIKKRDRAIFIYCSILLHGIVYLLGSQPEYYFLWSICSTIFGFLISRVYLFFEANKPLQIFDFPYYAAMMFGIFLLLFPGSQTLYMFCYCASLGTLSVSVYYLKVSMIMHKFNSTIDMFLKLAPLITMWNIHWNIRGIEGRAYWGFYDPSNDSLSIEFITKYFLCSILVYLPWACFFFTMIPMNSQRYGDIIFLKEVGETKGKVIYFSGHVLIFMTVGCLIGAISYFYQFLHIVMIFVVSIISFWNGGDYYMEYFGRNYEQNIMKLDEKKNN